MKDFDFGFDKKHLFHSIILINLFLLSACGLGAILRPQSEATPSSSESFEIAMEETSVLQEENAVSDEILATQAPDSVPAAEWKSNWLHFGVDDQFSSYQPDETLINSGNVANMQLIYGSGCEDALFTVMGGTPALYRGEMLVTYSGGKLEAGNPYTGLVDWDFGENAMAWAPTPVVSSDGIVYYLYVTPDSSSKLFAINAATGQQIWQAGTQFKTGFNYDAQVAVDEENGMLYVIEDEFSDGRLFGIDRATGEIQWWLGGEQDETGVRYKGMTVLLKDNRLYVPAVIPEEMGDRLHMVRVDPSTQKIDITYALPEELNLSWEPGWSGLCNERLFETLQDSSREATVLVAHPLDQPVISWQINIPAQTGRYACDPQKDILYVPTVKGLLAIEAGTGSAIWEHNTLDSVFSPTIANGVIYYLSETNMYAINQEDASPLFRYPLGTNADASTGVAVNDGLVIFSGSGGTCDLYVLGLK